MGKGSDVFIGKTGDDICPVAAVLAFLSIRGQHPGPLFVLQNGKACTKELFVSKV